jgi:hypothetical protein
MNRLALFTLILSVTFIFCKNSKKEQTQSSIIVADKIETAKTLDFSQLDYEIQEKMIDSAWQSIMAQVPSMNVKTLNKPFYKHMVGSFNGHKAVLNLSFGHFTYDGEWATEGALYDYVDNVTYKEFSTGFDTLNYLVLHIDDKINNSYEIRGALIENTFKGIALNSNTLQHFPVEFVTQNTEGVVDLDIYECFNKELYTGIKPSEDDRDFYTIYSHYNPLAKPTNKSDIAQFLNDNLRIEEDCAEKCAIVKKEGDAFMNKIFKEETNSRNSEYSIIENNLAVWNDDNLLVISKFDWGNTDLLSYGGAGLWFDTYDYINKKKLTSSDAFLGDYNQNKNLDKAILSFLGFEEGKSLDFSDGFTSKGFYVIGSGNHGWRVTPFFIPYHIVEPFLKEDFKKQYWKK